MTDILQWTAIAALSLALLYTSHSFSSVTDDIIDALKEIKALMEEAIK